MRWIALFSLFAAWTALQMPWEQCSTECHVLVVPAGEHCHHDCDDCAGQEDEPRHEHEAVDFDVVPPVAIVALPVVVTTQCASWAELRGARTPELLAETGAAPVPRSAVMLL